MNSSSIVNALNLTARLMELHEGNPFKIRAYTNAAFKLGKMRYNFEGKTREDIEQIEGIGKSISEKIFEISTTGTTADLNDLLSRTPPGIVEMLQVKGLGPKKVRQLWKELGCESMGELLYACNENRLVTLSGFGSKTQEQVLQAIQFSLSSSDKRHFATVYKPVLDLLDEMARRMPGHLIAPVGEFARKNETLSRIEILVAPALPVSAFPQEKSVPLPIIYHSCALKDFFPEVVRLSSAEAHLEKISFNHLPAGDYPNEESVYSALGLPFIPAELREGLQEVEAAKSGKLSQLITYEALKGVLHNHSTYSDGAHSLSEMADHCRSLGFTYLGICDHSRSAVYARGLTEDRIAEQHREIDELNSGYKDFRILKGIESDILADGSLDYPPEILSTFDFVVASVHSNLKMSEEKATARLIKAIENPYTSILGHPSGRLLLGRPGYPLDYVKIIDACAANNVSIELNSHPYRLDIDWRWIPYCLEKEVMISINPDAHQKESFTDMLYGVFAARKGMLPVKACLNSLDLADLLKVFAG